MKMIFVKKKIIIKIKLYYKEELRHPWVWLGGRGHPQHVKFHSIQLYMRVCLEHRRR